MTDGAPAYVYITLARQFGLVHLACNHSEMGSSMSRDEGRKRHRDVNTGSIDWFWARGKLGIPTSISPVDVQW